MSCSITLSFENYEELCEFIKEYKQFKDKKEKKKEKEFVDTYSNLTDIYSKEDKVDKQDKRGQHQIIYHNLAKQYQIEHPELSYRDSLRYVYKNNKVIEKTI